MAEPTPATHPIGCEGCDCYSSGFSPDTYEGPQPWCPVHGIKPSDRARCSCPGLGVSQDCLLHGRDD